MTRWEKDDYPRDRYRAPSERTEQHFKNLTLIMLGIFVGVIGGLML